MRNRMQTLNLLDRDPTPCKRPGERVCDQHSSSFLKLIRSLAVRGGEGKGKGKGREGKESCTNKLSLEDTNVVFQKHALPHSSMPSLS